MRTILSPSRHGGDAKGDLDTLVEVLKCDSLEEDLGSIRNRYKLLFEAIIWAKLYGFDRSRGGLITNSGKSLKGVEEELLTYWFKRFAKPIEEWSQRNAIGLLPFGIQAPIADGQYLKLPIWNRVSYMNQYLLAIGSSIPADPTVFLAGT